MDPQGKPSSGDLEFANDFQAMHALIEHAQNAEQVTLLLSTCRNAYLTANALFVDLQVLLADSSGSSLRNATELLSQGAEPKRVLPHLDRAAITLSEFHSKWHTWDRREELRIQIDKAKAELHVGNRVMADRAEVLLTEVVGQNGQNEGGWYQDVLKIDLGAKPHLTSIFDCLSKSYEALKACADLGRVTVGDYQGLQQKLSELPLGDVEPRQGRLRFNGCVERLANFCDWTYEERDESLVVQLVSDYKRPTHLPKRDRIVLPSQISPETMALAARDVGELMREALYFVHTQLRRQFIANLAAPPMPDPFVIQLQPPGPIYGGGDGDELQIHRIRCADRTGGADAVRVAIANLAVPEHDLDKYKLKPSIIESVCRDVRLAVAKAGDANCQAIVFPEYSIPGVMEPELLDLANKYQLAIVGGLDGEWADGKLRDKAAIAIPGESKVHGQLKQAPSLEEDVQLFHDNKVNVFCGSPIGDFCVVVCSDWLQLGGLQAWTADEPLPELQLVVARNPYFDVYKNFALADSIRLYAGIVIANVCDRKDGSASNEGSCVVVPSRETPIVQGGHLPVMGEYCKGIAVHQVSLHSIRARSRGKPVPGYFAVPKGAQRS